MTEVKGISVFTDIMNELLLNLSLVSLVTFLLARIVNFVCESAELSAKKKEILLRSLHLKALSGDHSSAEVWEKNKNKNEM